LPAALSILDAILAMYGHIFRGYRSRSYYEGHRVSGKVAESNNQVTQT